MKTLLVHPEDSPCSGPWAGEKWDLIVDLGKSSAFARAAWQERLDSPILQLDTLRRGIEDFDSIRQLLQAGRNQLLDEIGLDWWDLVSVLIYPELQEAVLLGRLAAQFDATTELYTTRQEWPASGVGLLLKRPLRTFAGTSRSSHFRHYRDVLRRFSFDQLAQIILDKYDARYRWRARFAPKRRGQPGPFVLLPSAYTNVSRMESAYASMLPEQSFLLVATRRSGTHFDPAPNVTCASLAAYAGGPEPQAEYADLVSKWRNLQQELARLPEIGLLFRAGLLESFPNHFRNGLAVRDAWRNVLSDERISAVMCGDDSNIFTRLPVLLARQQGIPTLDFHHGALDGRFLMKEMSSDLYLAKGEMERDYLLRLCRLPAERVILGGPPIPRSIPVHGRAKDEGSLILFFSEPYEALGGRTEDVYRELLPPLAGLAREFGRKLVVKLHPFESRTERVAIVAKVLPAEDEALVEVVGGPLAPELVGRAWFAVTVESTVVIDCSLLGVPCFLCEWLNTSPYGYARQYAHFGVGRMLNSPAQLNDLPRMLEGAGNPVIRRLSVKANRSGVVTPNTCRGCRRRNSEGFAENKLVAACWRTIEMGRTQQLITIFTPSHADAAFTNAQQLTVKEIVVRLPAERFRVAMFSGEQPDPRIAARPNTLLIPAGPHGNTRRFLTRLLLARPDVYFYPRFGPVDNIFFSLRSKLRLKTAVVTHVVMIMNESTAKITGRSIREADAVFANSRYVAETVRNVFGVEAGTIHNGVDRRFFFPREESSRPGPLVVLYAGSFQARKRVELIIQQAARHRQVQFRLAGSGETEPACRALAQQLNCRNIEFLGHLTPIELGNEMRKSDVFLFPSILEGHPQVLGQASACGLPSIAMNLYRPDYVLNGESGFLVESDAELAEKLELLLRDADVRHSMSRAAALHALKFDWDRIALQWQEVFEAVTAKR